MSHHRLPFSLLLLLLSQIVHFQTLPLILALTLVDSNNTQVLEGVLKEISERQSWDLDAITTSKLRVSKVRFGTARRYEFRIRFGKTRVVFKFPNEVDSWNKSNLEEISDFGNFVKEVDSDALLDTLKVEGPFDLRVGGQDQLSLSFPVNASYRSLKRVLVGEGITVEVRRAQELSLFTPFGHSFNVNGSNIDRGRTGPSSFWHLMCMPLPPLYVIGSVSLIAYRTNNPDAPIETTILPDGTIELLPAKCYSNNAYKNKSVTSDFLSLKIDRLGKLLRSLLNEKMGKILSSGSFRAHVKASTIFRFQLEVEKNIGRNETLKGVLEEWRTRPTVERVWFEITARLEAEKLMPLMVKKVRPFIAVDSATWSNLMYNISFTKFPSMLVPPEALTLDVKW